MTISGTQLAPLRRALYLVSVTVASVWKLGT